ncbi:MAG: hypothetical protein FWC50_05495, partial [Planctomycetaceae bacterium]|nr:hypothetical protein [Planctomycetaceae bacterium]
MNDASDSGGNENHLKVFGKPVFVDLSENEALESKLRGGDGRAVKFVSGDYLSARVFIQTLSNNCPSRNNLGHPSEPRQLWSGRTGHSAALRSRLLFRMTSFFMRRSVTVKKQIAQNGASHILTRNTRKDGNCGIPRIPS